MYDLIVIGGGPAGCSAAISAARAGARVLLLERGRYPRQKVCGEFVSAESLDLLRSLLVHCPDSLSLLDRAPRIDHGRLFVDSTVLQAAVHPSAASIPRYALDDNLWRAALQAGVDARQQQTAVTFSGTGPFIVVTSAESFESRSVINATGRWSNLRSPAPDNGHGPKWIGLKAHFSEHSPPLSVDLYFFQGGYCGVQPIDRSEINACAMVRSDLATSLPEVFEQHPALRNRADKWHQTTDVVSTSPLVFKAPDPNTDDVLMAGDAAGFVDPFVGDGISLALRSGALAAQSLAAFWDGRVALSDAVISYRASYNRQLLPIFRTSSTIRRLFALPYPARAALLFLFGHTPALTRYLVSKTR